VYFFIERHLVSLLDLAKKTKTLTVGLDLRGRPKEHDSRRFFRYFKPGVKLSASEGRQQTPYPLVLLNQDCNFRVFNYLISTLGYGKFNRRLRIHMPVECQRLMHAKYLHKLFIIDYVINYRARD